MALWISYLIKTQKKHLPLSMLGGFKVCNSTTENRWRPRWTNELVHGTVISRAVDSHWIIQMSRDIWLNSPRRYKIKRQLRVILNFYHHHHANDIMDVVRPGVTSIFKIMANVISNLLYCIYFFTHNGRTLCLILIESLSRMNSNTPLLSRFFSPLSIE